jgi:hypothetical protein
MGHLQAQRRLLQIRSSARNRADSLPTHAGSLILRTSPVDPKSMSNFPVAPNGGGKTPISRDGGSQPRWRRDRKELFYSSPDGKLMAADVTEGTTFKADVPRALFQMPVAQVSHDALALRVFGWDVAPGGRRFLVDTATTSTEPATVLLNRTAELKKEIAQKE